VAPYLNPFRLVASWRDNDAAKLYGAIVAQARLPVFYQSLGVSDRVEGRFLVLSINVFAVLHRLKQGGPEAHRLAQALSDRFSADMETVLRELGVGDLAIPKQMRTLAASSRTLLQAYANASARGEEALAAEIAIAFPFLRDGSKDATSQLAHYLMVAVRALEAQPVAALAKGEVRFPKAGSELDLEKIDD
jgi:cytochrome b pre-mRNA-processing protein 3